MFSIYKYIIDIFKKSFTLETQGEVICLKESVLELQKENQKLKEQVKHLEEKLNEKEEIVFKRPFYWKKVNGEMLEGPFCQRCRDSDEKLIRLQQDGDRKWYCTQCSQEFFGEDLGI